MDYIKELKALQTWIKTTANINSMRISEAKPKVSRPVILWEVPGRSKDRNIGRYQYVNRVRQYGRLFVTSTDEALDIQNKLMESLENNQNMVPITDNGTETGMLKSVTLEFSNSEDLDIRFNIQYEATYGRTRPEEAPPAAAVYNKVITKY